MCQHGNRVFGLDLWMFWPHRAGWSFLLFFLQAHGDSWTQDGTTQSPRRQWSSVVLSHNKYQLDQLCFLQRQQEQLPVSGAGAQQQEKSPPTSRLMNIPCSCLQCTVESQPALSSKLFTQWNSFLSVAPWNYSLPWSKRSDGGERKVTLTIAIGQQTNKFCPIRLHEIRSDRRRLRSGSKQI